MDGYRMLKQGEVIRPGDEAYTWTNKEYRTPTWVAVEPVMFGRKFAQWHVPMRRSILLDNR